VRDVISLSWGVSGEGVLAVSAIATWDGFFTSNASRNVRIELVAASPIGIISYLGKAHLENFEITGSRGNRGTINVQMSGDGELVRAPAL
jgi:hypothetical protein